ncbi:hypothetical protein ASPVEDRAFT_40846 [Aspergillus versicolor CBS 583.65]|uniref:Uncharacterized protein n=1 Tax=Aspergillus versicolor CBS 583.65 TaxID=1036611 RepID=A0A1L9PIL3_ASPVE|nr:uncharacterized protein ASPVEDRAFT_40846 [Aspergillus versicolor CBS 583.65]OJJ01275.1 hypothetical protein ASPVEDRAFT_40846 [Aspergillus versicolor CBS 583.65]
MYPRIWKPFVLIAGTFPAVTAQICNSPNGSYYFIENQPQLDALADTCTTLNASLNILPPYDGPFYLPNIRNITGNIRYQNDYDASKSEPTPTSIDLPDLEYCASVYLGSLPSLRNVSMPKLKTVDWNLQVDYAPEIDFRAVQTAEYASFTGGDLSRIRLDSLREVRQRLVLCNKNACNESITASKPFDISLPRLESVGTVRLGGRISSLDMPQFNKVSGNGGEFYGFRLDTEGGPTLNLTFPQLRGVYSYMSLAGEIGSLSMPNFKNTTQSRLTVNASSVLDINLPIEFADDISLYGDISSVQFPNLKHVDSLNINSNLELDCDSTLDTLAMTLNTTVGSGDGLSCTSSNGGSAKPPKSRLVSWWVLLGWLVCLS